jgi:hypothetical protein
VLFAQDAEVSARVRAAIDENGGFALAGECLDWTACEALLENCVPELLIASVELLPSNFVQQLPEAEFPVLLGIGGEGLATVPGMFDCLHVPPEPEYLCRLLGRVQFEIYRRKADGLSSLLQRYMAGAARSDQYLSRLSVEDDKIAQEIPVEQVMLIVADGNYVRVHADAKTYLIRETMTGISAKLDHARFARVHRSFIVNLAYVMNVVTKDGGTTFVRLSDGMEVPVGPNYRGQFEKKIGARVRLSA